MFRYLALMWNGGCGERCAVAKDLARRLCATGAEWSLEFSGVGLGIWVANDTVALSASPLQGEAGLVLGEMFLRQTNILDDVPVQHAVFDEPRTREVLASQGRCLSAHYWGNYIAFIVDPKSPLRLVVNDPTGSLPCYFTEFRGVRIFFSCLPDCLALGVMRFSVNWSFVRRRTVNGISDVEAYPFTEIGSVQRGECVRFDRDGECVSRSFYWHPESFADPSQSIDDADLAARAVRATVRSCVHSLVGAHSSVLQQTSGGLDSSIVLGCVGGAPNDPQVTCYSNYVPEAPCDTRRWARCAASRLGCRHVEVACDAARLVLDEMPDLVPSVEPVSSLTHWQRGPVERRLAADCEATAVFTGEGGDSTFCATCFVLAVDCYLRRYGLGRRTWRMATLAAVRRDRTVWHVLFQALRRQWRGTSLREHRSLMAGYSQLIHAEARNSVAVQRHFPHPWFSASDKVPMESLWRLGVLAYPPSFYDLSTSQRNVAPYTVSPLCAQPVIEVCRRIPVDIQFDAGKSRGLARRAFAAEVPAPILRRQWKDRPMSQSGKIIQRNLTFVRETLLDGDLCKERVLDRVAVELALRTGPTKSRALSSEILKHLDLELWIARSRRAVA
jgi:asparagine synthase (glutamine-hydrolysing)